MAERLADKYEEAKEKQEDIMNRWVQTTLFHHRPLAVVQQFASVVEERGRRCHPSLLEDWASEFPSLELSVDFEYYSRSRLSQVAV